MRIGKVGVYASHESVPTPDVASAGFLYRYSGDGEVYIKTSDGISKLVGSGGFMYDPNAYLQIGHRENGIVVVNTRAISYNSAEGEVIGATSLTFPDMETLETVEIELGDDTETCAILSFPKLRFLGLGWEFGLQDFLAPTIDLSQLETISFGFEEESEVSFYGCYACLLYTSPSPRD